MTYLDPRSAQAVPVNTNQPLPNTGYRNVPGSLPASGGGNTINTGSGMGAAGQAAGLVGTGMAQIDSDPTSDVDVAGDTLAAAGTGLATGASIGSAVGPWGTVIGGAVGAIAGGAYGYIDSSGDAEEAESQQQANRQGIANNRAIQSYQQNNQPNQNIYNFDARYAYGGNLNMQTNENDISKIEGNKHLDGGVELTPSIEVEDGEVKWNDYIFSDSIDVPKGDVTFAKEATKIMEKYQDRLGKDYDNPDRASQISMSKELEELKQEQELIRQTEYNNKISKASGDVEKIQEEYPDLATGNMSSNIPGQIPTEEKFYQEGEVKRKTGGKLKYFNGGNPPPEQSRTPIGNRWSVYPNINAVLNEDYSRINQGISVSSGVMAGAAQGAAQGTAQNTVPNSANTSGGRRSVNNQGTPVQGYGYNPNNPAMSYYNPGATTIPYNPNNFSPRASNLPNDTQTNDSLKSAYDPSVFPEQFQEGDPNADFKRDWRDYIAPASSAAKLGMLAYQYGNIKDRDINLPEYDPDLVSYQRGRNAMRSQGDISRAVSRQNIANYAPGRGAALSNMVASEAAIADKVGRGLAGSIEAEENTNAQLRNSARQFNTQQATRESMLEYQEKIRNDQLKREYQSAMMQVPMDYADRVLREKQFEETLPFMNSANYGTKNIKGKTYRTLQNGPGEVLYNYDGQGTNKYYWEGEEVSVEEYNRKATERQKEIGDTTDYRAKEKQSKNE